MKYFVTICLFFILLSSTNSFAQEAAAKDYNQSIGVNPIGLIFGLVNVTYEQQLSAENSFTVNVNYWDFLGWTAFGFGGSYRWYLMQDQDKALKGLSFGPVVAVGFWSYDYDGFVLKDYAGGTSFAIGGEAAYKFIFNSGFTIEPIIQLTINVLDVSGLAYRSYSIGANLGYSW